MPPFGAAVGTSAGRMMTGRIGTGAGGGDGPRPMTSVKGAGYSSNPAAAAKAAFDPLNQAARGPAPALAAKADNSPEDLAKEMEKQVNKLIEDSAHAAVGGDVVQALERAKEAGKKERQLQKHRESNGLVDQINLDLTYSVCFNLANAYHLNGMFAEALNTYSLIVKNKQYPQSGRLRVNMGNIYYQEKKFPVAIKMYRMALDQIPNTGKEVRLKIMRNIGNAFVRMGQFQDAIQSYEAIMEGNADFQTGFNLVVCYYALGDSDKMKKGFTQLLSIAMPVADEEEVSSAATPLPLVLVLSAPGSHQTAILSVTSVYASVCFYLVVWSMLALSVSDRVACSPREPAPPPPCPGSTRRMTRLRRATRTRSRAAVTC